MMVGEKERLLALLADEGSWCQDAEAHGADGVAVCCTDEAAVAWDLTGALCRLFGWRRACALFGQLDRHIHGRRRAFGWPRHNTALDAMAALQEFNDRSDMTFSLLRGQIESMPVWRGEDRRHEVARDE